MAIREEVNFSEYSTNINVAVNQTTIFARVSEEAEDKSKNFGQTLTKFGNDVLKTESVMKSLNEHTHGYATKVKEVVDVTKLFITEKKAATAVQWLYSKAVGSSTGVMKGFRAALIGTGIGAIVVLIGALIGNFDKIKKVVLSVAPDFAKVGEAIGGIVNWVTDFIGATSDASRALDKMAEDSDKSIKRSQDFLDMYGDKYDEFTKAKFQANIDYHNKVKEINDDEDLSEQEKLKKIAIYADKRNRLINKADDDRAAANKKRRDDEAAAQKAADDKLREEARKMQKKLLRKQNAGLMKLLPKKKNAPMPYLKYLKTTARKRKMPLNGATLKR